MFHSCLNVGTCRSNIKGNIRVLKIKVENNQIIRSSCNIHRGSVGVTSIHVLVTSRHNMTVGVPGYCNHSDGVSSLGALRLTVLRVLRTLKTSASIGPSNQKRPHVPFYIFTKTSCSWSVRTHSYDMSLIFLMTV